MSGIHSLRLRPLSAAVLLALCAAGHAAEGEAGPPPRHTTAEQVMPEVTVSGTGIGVSRAAYPGSVSVLERDSIALSTGVVDALSRVPGFSFGGGSGRDIGQHFNIRGFGYQSEERVIIKQDGIRRSASLFSNHISSFRMDGDLLKRVEVVKGSSSVAHGSGAIGGVISTTTADANDFLAPGAETGIATRLRYDHNNRREGYVALASAPAGSAFDLLAFVKKSHDGDIKLARPVGAAPNQYQHTDNDEKGTTYFFKAGWNLAPRQRLALSYFDMGQRVETAWQTLWHAQTPASGPISGKLTQRDWSLRYTANPAGLPWLNLEANLYNAEASYRRGYDYLNAGKRTVVDYLNADKRTGFDIQNKFAFAALGARHRMLVGLSYEHRNEDARMVQNGELSDFGSMPNTYQDSGLYLQEEMSLLDDKLVLHMGGRYDRFRRKVKNKNNDYSDSNFSPRLGASYAVGGGVILLGNYSRTYRAPTPHETSASGALNPFYWYLPSPDLKPEHSKERELGASLTRSNLLAQKDSLFAKAMYFNGKISQMIALTALPEMGPPPQSESYARYTNADLVKRRGYEIELEYRQPLWEVDASYEHLKLVNQATGKNYPYAFADKLRLGAGYWLTPETSIGLAVSHWRKPDQNPATYASGKKTEYYVRDSYTITDLNLRWQPAAAPWKVLGRQVEVVAGVRNLFDKPYLNAMKPENTAQVGKARNIYVSMSNRF